MINGAAVIEMEVNKPKKNSSRADLSQIQNGVSRYCPDVLAEDSDVRTKR